MATSEADIGDLADQCDRLGGSLQRSWLAQAALAVAGLLYVSKSEPASALRDTVVVDFDVATAVVALGFFMATLYLFPGFGLWLRRYFMARQALIVQLHAGRRRPYVPYRHGLNLTLFRSVSQFIDSVDMGRPLKDVGPSLLRMTPILFVTAVVLSIAVLNNALSAYFAYFVAEP